MRIYPRAPLAAALAAGAIGGLLIGVGLPRTQAKAPAAADRSISTRLTQLESRVAILEAEVKKLQAQPPAIIGGRGFGNHGFGAPPKFHPKASNIPPYSLIPLGR